ncbi:MAG: lipid-A-disaccharide synthase, partial [Synergistaceae bacterium]|nr:lipid-A-disaccharide synthase [Synergistaceae bacterium]
DELRERVSESGFDFWEGSGRELMLASEAAAGVSGTVSVEAMILRRYMVVIYNMRPLNYAILKRLVHVKNISIPNMLTGRQVYPELLCDEAKPERIVKELERYLNDEDEKSEIDNELTEARLSMGEGNASEFWAETVLRS